MAKNISLDLAPKVTVIILNWNGKDDTLECLSSVKSLSYTNYNVIVVDNGSTDNSLAAISAVYPDIFILENGSNLGFAEGNNRAIEYALDHDADAVVILNNDTIVDTNLLTAFNEAYITLPEAGILGAVSYYYDHPAIIWAAGGLWDPTILDLRHIGLGKTEAYLPSTQPFEVEYVVGCAIFIHRNVIKKVGLMDPIYFLNFEENDWCRRAKKLGFTAYTVPNAKIWHKISSSFGGESPLWKYYMTRNLLLWSKRYLSAKEHRSVLKKTIKEVFPKMSLSHLNLKQRYWTLITWFNQLKFRLHNPFYLAQCYGIFHYFSKQFGCCPDDLKLKWSQKK